MKKIFVLLSAMLFAGSISATTLTPVQLLNPAGSTSGQVIASTGASTAPAWTTVTLSGLGGLAAANNLSDVANAATSRTNLGLGTAAVANTGTSGATVPLLSAANTWTLAQAFTVRPTFNGNTPFDSGNLTIANYATLASPSLTGAPLAPTAAAATNTTQIATTAFTTTAVANQAALTFGSGQSLSNVVGSRAIGTTYTNSTTKPIFVYVSFTATTAGQIAFNLNSAQFGTVTLVLNGYNTFTFVVPPSATYSLSISSGAFNLNTWEELR